MASRGNPGAVDKPKRKRTDTAALDPKQNTQASSRTPAVSSLPNARRTAEKDQPVPQKKSRGNNVKESAGTSLAAKPTASVQEQISNVRTLEQQARQSLEQINNLATLLQYCNAKDDEVVHAALHSAHRVLTPYMENGTVFRSASGVPPEQPAAVVHAWLRETFDVYLEELFTKLSHPEPGVQLPVLDLLMQAVAKESAWLSQQDGQHSFANELFLRVLSALLHSHNWNDQLVGGFTDKYANTFDDVRFYLYRNLTKIAQGRIRPKKSEGADAAELIPSLEDRVYAILSEINMVTKVDEIDSFLSGHPEQSQSERSAGPSHTYKRVLLHLDRDVIPHLMNPSLLIDFLTDAYNMGGITSLLALNGLYYLISKQNLDYPDFFPKLYSLLKPALMFVKYRARFFRLLDSFLQSPLLPAYLVAAFIKRLARLALVAPPPAALTNLAIIYNLILRHPSCAILIHRDADQDTDPFQDQVDNPAQANALASSLWEITMLKSHYDPAVQRLAAIFEEPFRLQPQEWEYYLTLSYPTLFEREMKRSNREAVTPVAHGGSTVLFGDGGAISALLEPPGA